MVLCSPHQFEHLEPLVQCMQDPKDSQGAQSTAQARIAGTPTLQRHHQPHAKKGQPIEKVDQDEQKICHDLAWASPPGWTLSRKLRNAYSPCLSCAPQVRQKRSLAW